ncbi:MAG: DMT family transporter [Betaproteobacteria bacterium]|nr:DMT family transporter [Betaproteobacteria bacterium]
MPALRISPHLMLMAASVFWGAHWVVARGIVAHVSPMGMSFWRWTIALLLLLPFAWAPLQRDRARLAAAWKTILFFGCTGTVLYNAMGYFGLRQSTATNALLFQSLIPGLIPLFAFLLFRERIGALTAIGLCTSFLGVLAIVFRLDAGELAAFRFNAGDLWLLGNVCLWALYTACLRWAPKDVHPVSLFYAVMLAGMVTGLPAYALDAAAGGRVDWSGEVLAGLVYLGAFPSVVCFLLWSKGVAAVGPAKAGSWLHVTPLSGIVMASLFLGERVETHHAVGFVLILAGVWLATRGRAA